MPIAQFLQGQNFDRETIRVMGIAFEMTRTALGSDRGDLVNEVIARKVMEVAKAGETNPDRICEATLIYFRGQRL